MRSTANPTRRGVVLLLILGLLAMFGLVGMAFVMLASHSATTARTHQQMEEMKISPRSDLDEAAMQVLRGSNNQNSALRFHGLLEDMYGFGQEDVIGNVQAVAGGALFEFTLSNGVANPAGRVLTVNDPNSPANGLSTFIVSTNPNSGNPQALAFDGVYPTPESGDRFIISGRPFSGSGFNNGTGGLNPQPGAIDVTGGANEDYDAPDFQNWLLAAQLDSNEDGQVDAVIPSLHRPAVVQAAGGAAATNMLRPLTLDASVNPNFNPGWNGIINSTTGPRWDVDNDGDGIMDSVWVDLDLPPRPDAKGRLVKPLFAILCLDMDGRLNVNAHGSLVQSNAAYYSGPTADTNYQFAGGSGALIRGQGLGPAEVNLSPLFTTSRDIGTHAGVSALLTGGAGWPGRYGANSSPGTPGEQALSMNRWFEYSGNYWSNTLDSYGTPPDVFGTAAVGLDVGGTPLWRQTIGGGAATGQQPIDDPYEFDPSQRDARGLASAGTQPVDLPFSPAELERVLRCYDRDAPTLPTRLWELGAAGGPTLERRRQIITTDSWDTPVPGYPTFTALLSNRGIPQQHWRQLFDPDLLDGRRMNINRALGNGRDDPLGSGNDVVDEGGESSEAVQLYGSPNASANVGVADDPAGLLTANPLMADGISAYNRHQLLARHLYCLAMVLTPSPAGTNPAPFDTAQNKARALAQWAANVVDFRDRDSIMTYFPYDENITDGWNPDGDPQRVVFGCERPELLISETLAFHDRRTEDRDDEQPTSGEKAKKTLDDDPDDDEPSDTDFDQRFKPQGSLFVELYNPWPLSEPRTGELHQANAMGHPAGGGVALDAAPGGSPTWRLAIVDGSTPETADPDSPSSTVTVDRSVYFVTADPSVNGDGQAYYPQNGGIAPILPGRYVLIGPGEPDESGTATTNIGWNVGEPPKDTNQVKRRIELTQNPSPSVKQVAVYSAGGNDEIPAGSAQPPAAVVINQPHRLNISQPDDGYTNVDPLSQPYAPATGYQKPYDEPLDKREDNNWSEYKQNQTLSKHKVIYLQRLANPLLPFNATTNPYRTIDAMAVDLTTFNGVTDDVNQNDSPDGDEPGTNDGDSSDDFRTCERGENNDSTNQNNLWPREVFNSARNNNSNFATPSGHRFNSPLHHTLGFLNDPFGQPRSSPAAHVGMPQQEPFPWLTWNNRPFTSAAEVLMVPATSPWELLDRNRFSLASGSTSPYTSLTAPFGHLWSFFDSGTAGGSAELHRLLDYLTVPSRFTGSWVQANPQLLANSAGQHIFPPPFHLIPRYREPGKVNLNTIFSERVFNGLMNGFDGSGSLWADFLVSRRGYGGSSNHPFEINPSLPTRFAEPFRSAGSHGLRPASAASQWPNRQVEATLLRSAPGSNNRPLFAQQSSQDANDTDRNPYFRYQGIMRLPNLVTTRSNVYAVWITVGYFQVDGNGNPLREAGSDTGDVQRHRAFYLIDRSVPVGFMRGSDLNAEKAILLRTMIE